MSVNFRITLLVGTPILIIFIIGIASQIVAYKYLLYFIQDYIKNIMQDQIMFTQQNSHSASIKIGAEAFNIPYHLTIVNNFYQKLLNGQAIKNTKYIPSIISFQELYQQSTDQYLLEMYPKNQNLINCWFYQYQMMNQLKNSQIQNQLYNATFLNPLLNSIMKSKSFDSQYMLNILNFNVSFFFYSSGLLYSTAMNLTTNQLFDDDSCFENKISLKSSYNCYSQFAQAHKQETTYFSQPYKLQLGNQPPFLGQFGCQKLVWYNSTSKLNELYHTFCYQINDFDLFNFLQQQNLNQIQLFSFETSKNLILFDNSGQNELSNIYEVLKNLYNFNSQDLEFLQNFTMNSQQLEQQTFDYFNLGNKVDASFPNYYQKQINYSSYSFIYNPVFILDKIKSISSQNQKSGKYKYLLHSIYIQIISDNNLQQKANNFQQFTTNLFLAVSIILLVLIIFFAFIAIYYSLIFNDLILSPIGKMIKGLRRLHSQKNSQNFLFIFNQIISNHEKSILSKEVYDLTISLQQILQVLLSVSENYFENDQAETLIRLYRNIQFFKSSQNYYALGITHNNIGAILVNQGHFQHALEHYQQSIVYARYEIQEFCRQHPCSQNYEYLLNYCYDSSNVSNIIYHQEFKNQTQKNKTKINGDEIQLKQKIRKAYCLKNILEYFKNKTNKKKNQIKINTDEQESIQKFVDLFGISLIVDDRNDELDEETSKDEYYYQRMQLLLNLYYRKVNYNLALIWYQTSIDKQHSSLNKNSKIQNNSIILLNFWQEIKKKCQEIKMLINQIGLSDQQKIMNLIFLRICYSKLNKYHKIEQINEEINTLIQKNKLQKKITENQVNSQIDSNDSNSWLFNQNLNLKSQNIAQQKEEVNKKLRKNQQANAFKQLLKSQFNENYSSNLDQQAKQIDVNMGSNQEVYDQFLDIPKQQNNQRQKNKSYISYNQQKIISNLEKFYNNQITNKSSNNNINAQIKINDNNNTENLTEVFSQNQFFFKEISPNFLKRNTTSLQNIQNYQKSQQKQLEQQGKQQKIETQVNNLQSRNIILKEQINKKYDQFFKQQKKNQISFDKSQMAKENMIIMSKITYSDILINQNKYLSAALLLTDIVENSKFFLSHTVYTIYNKLKEIFEHYNIYSKQLDQILQSLNKNINLQVLVIFNTSKNHDNWMHTFFMVGQLFEKVLKQQDKFGSVQIKQDEFEIMENFRILPIKQVKPVIHILFRRYKERFFDVNKDIFEKNTDFLNQTQEIFFNSSKNIIQKQRISQQSQQEFFSQQKQNFQQKVFKAKQQQIEDHQRQDINLELNDDTLPNSHNNFFSNLQFNKNSTNYNNKENNRLDQNKFKIQLNDFSCYKFEEHLGDNQEPNLPSQNSLEDDIEGLENNQAEIIKQNTLFHFSIRKALKQFLDLNIITFKCASQKYKKENINLNQAKVLDEKLKYQFTNNQHLQISKQHIIFSTSSICIIKNKLFEELIKILSNYKIQLLIFSMKKGNNFLETQQDLKFIHNDQEVIIIFYEIEQLINFLISKRNNIQQDPRITYVQHY
ncbi:hypothetical protein ABPG72_018234 [Tetrahymena utriculariae]